MAEDERTSGASGDGVGIATIAETLRELREKVAALEEGKRKRKGGGEKEGGTKKPRKKWKTGIVLISACIL